MRWAYRRLAENPTLVDAFQRVPFWATWDDHYWLNASDGTLPNKENSRKAFVEYRPLPNVGENGLATYTSFRRGGVEVFLVSTRAGLRGRKSPGGGWRTKEGLLGLQQWAWLQRGWRVSLWP